MTPGRVLVLLAVAMAVQAGASDAETLAELAEREQWRAVLEVARLRAEQLPLRPEEALIAAAAARRFGDAAAERGFLERAAIVGPTAEVAAVELAELLADTDPAAAVARALPVLVAPTTTQLGDAAGRAVERAVSAGAAEDSRRRIATALRRVRRHRSRPIEVALGRADDDPDRLRAVLQSSNRDLAALEAAGILDRRVGESPATSFRVAETFYRHARYDVAAQRLEALAGSTAPGVPADRVAFLRGRCAFRGGRWEEAAAWYRKAVATSRTAEDRADRLVHLARTLELAGDLDAAVETARTAVLTRKSDDRRLFLARLRLRRGEPDLALLGISRLRSRAARDRGMLLVALDELARGDDAAAAERLGRVRRAPWSAPASVLLAREALGRSRPDQALETLAERASNLHGPWVLRAREVMGEIPPPLVDRWRTGIVRELETGDERRRRRALATWSVLEPDPARVPAMRAWAAAVTGVNGPEPPVLGDSLAGLLWNLGMPAAAARWDRGSLPSDTAGEALWSAVAMLEHGSPADSIRLADRAWRLAGADLDPRVHPPELVAAMLPLPAPAAVRDTAAAAGVAWPLVAAVAREESRWDPRAVSAVGARGLMQLMPSTAVAVADRIGLPSSDLDLFDAPTALTLGAAELARLVDVFGGRRAPAVAAYNAGEAQARQWLEQCGAGCSEERYLAQISFAATRNYTADVLWSAEGYRELADRGAVGSVVSSRDASAAAAAAASGRSSPDS